MIGTHKIIIDGKEETLYFTMLQTGWMNDLINAHTNSNLSVPVALVLSALQMGFKKKGEDCPYTYEKIEDLVDEWYSDGSDVWDDIQKAYQESSLYKKRLAPKEEEKKKFDFDDIRRFAYGHLRLSVSDFENMLPRDYYLMVEGFNERTQIERDNELFKLRFARKQAFFSYCAVSWKGQPLTFEQFCKQMMPLEGDVEEKKKETFIMTDEMHMRIQNAHRINK